jgi:FtsH-binding integral membrane protein
MLTIAVIVFAIGAIGGLVLANSVLRGQLASWALSLLHAALGAAGLVLTAIVVLGPQGSEAPKIAATALIILVVAALGGFFLASYHARKASPPKGVVVAHAGIAVVGFLLLLGGVLHFI